MIEIDRKDRAADMKALIAWDAIILEKTMGSHYGFNPRSKFRSSPFSIIKARKAYA